MLKMTDEKQKKLLLLTLSENDAEALAALRALQRANADWHKFVESIFPTQVAVSEKEVTPSREAFERMAKAAKKQREELLQKQEEDLGHDSDIFYYSSFRNKKLKGKGRNFKGDLSSDESN